MADATDKKKVVILGGGVAGMSAAHELLKRGFDVEVYERQDTLGGKAKSVRRVEDAPSGWHRPRAGERGLPGEHGFRFFPRFYRNLFATLDDIPCPSGRNAHDNLVETTRGLVASRNPKEPQIEFATRFPRTWEDVRFILKTLRNFRRFGPEERADMEFFLRKVWQVASSCEERRDNEYERMGWWDFIGATERSEFYRVFYATGLTRTLVAARATEANARTAGRILLQLMYGMILPGLSTDRVLSGPTSETWIEPWRDYLERTYPDKPIFHCNATAIDLQCEVDAQGQPVRRVKSATVSIDGVERQIEGDYFVLAIPVEAFAELLNNNGEPARNPHPDWLTKADPGLEAIFPLAKKVEWMTGIQFYLKEETPIVHGHVNCVDSPWALTAIAQRQFWDPAYLPLGVIRRPGEDPIEIRDVLSVDISDWDEKGLDGHKPAEQCTREEIARETWKQLKACLNKGGVEMLPGDYAGYYMDENLQPFEASANIDRQSADPDHFEGGLYRNMEPLFVNQANTWSMRPECHTEIANLVLAADYVKTDTDLATMEAANEAARRAVNCIIDADRPRRGRKYCRVYSLSDPWWLSPFRFFDRRRYSRGLPWKSHPFTVKIFVFVFGGFLAVAIGTILRLFSWRRSS